MINLRKLAQITDYEDLFEFLSSELDWQIDTEDYEIDDYIFEFDHKELGISKSKQHDINKVLQLRPLVAEQPWGIFFVELAPNGYYTYTVKHILKKLSKRKRDSANPSERAVWDYADLIIIVQRNDGFIFHHARDIGNPSPYIATFGWEYGEEDIDNTAKKLEFLKWPENIEQPDDWKEQWSRAFLLTEEDIQKEQSKTEFYFAKAETREALGQFWHEIKEIPLLSAEEEVELGEIITHGTEDEVADAKEKFTLANLRLVVAIATRKYLNQGLDVQDLVQEGILGLQRAIEDWDYTRGLKFSTYAWGWIQQAIRRAVHDKGKLIRIPVHMSEQVSMVNRIKKDLYKNYGIEASIAGISSELGKSEEDVQKVFDAQYDIIEWPIFHGNSFVDFKDRLIESPIDRYEPIALSEKFEDVFERLSEREIFVIKARTGMLDGKEHTLEEVGKELGVTRERIRQIQSRVKRKLKAYITQKDNPLKLFLSDELSNDYGYEAQLQENFYSYDEFVNNMDSASDHQEFSFLASYYEELESYDSEDEFDNGVIAIETRHIELQPPNIGEDFSLDDICDKTNMPIIDKPFETEDHNNTVANELVNEANHDGNPYTKVPDTLPNPIGDPFVQTGIISSEITEQPKLFSNNDIPEPQAPFVDSTGQTHLFLPDSPLFNPISDSKESANTSSLNTTTNGSLLASTEEIIITPSSVDYRDQLTLAKSLGIDLKELADSVRELVDDFSKSSLGRLKGD